MKCALGLIISAALSLSSVALSANAASVPDLESELTELLDTFTGRYSGEVPDPTDVSGERKMLLHHKIVRVDLPRFGEYVLYHQISRDALDSALATKALRIRSERESQTECHAIVCDSERARSCEF
jgi:hypothetical protein